MRIVVTGFGPFGGFSTNPSGVIVKSLDETFDNENVELITHIVNVNYTEAMEYSKIVCDELQADFAIHVGVQPTKGKISLETMSFGDGYICQDVKGLVPLMNRCEANLDGQTKTIKTLLDCEELKKRTVEAFKGQLPGEVQIEISHDPGRYLCAYIYYCSLHLLKGRSLFVHIPPFDEKCTPKVLTKILKQIVIELIKLNLHIQ